MSTENRGFSTLSAQAMPLDQANVDTDQIIPKQFLTSVSKVGFGRHLFHNWRYSDEQGQQDNPEFVLNLPQHKGSEILLARENFGCGSSREHAPWSLTDYGFKVVIATSFADIFYGNCMNNQLLPVALSSEQMDSLFAAVAADPALQISIDLPNQRVNFLSSSFEFTIAEHHKHNLMLGLDAIGQTLQASETIDNYEKLIPSWRA